MSSHMDICSYASRIFSCWVPSGSNRSRDLFDGGFSGLFRKLVSQVCLMAVPGCGSVCCASADGEAASQRARRRYRSRRPGRALALLLRGFTATSSCELTPRCRHSRALISSTQSSVESAVRSHFFTNSGTYNHA